MWLRIHVLPWVVWASYKCLTATWRKIITEPKILKTAVLSPAPVILAHWHGDELAVLHLVSRYRLATMTSTSKDGQLIDFVIRKLGGQTVQGSSTRGGIGALKGLVRLVRSNCVASMAVDGPKGPIYKVKPGVFELARLARAPIVAVGVSTSGAWVFHKSWNKAALPLPFSKVSMYFSEPLHLPEGADVKDPKLQQWLAQALSDAKQQAAKFIAQK